MKHFSHLNTAVQLLEQYRGEMPFSIFLRSYFAQHKKYGSKDRRRISHLCYSYFRLGHALRSFSIEERMLAALFLCSAQPDELLQHLKPEWNERMQLNINDKVDVLNKDSIPFSLEDIFSWKASLSEGIDHHQFCRSFLIQPDLFLRLRPGHETTVKQKLQNAEISFIQTSPSCLALPNSSKIDSIIDIDREAVIQDLSSQNTLTLLTANHKPPTTNRIPREVEEAKAPHIWDCCAASGGKSILAYDLIPGLRLTVSDVRESIIQNLKARFAKAGIKNYHAFVADLSTTNHKLPTTNQPTLFDLLICDAPCSGSGTWSRTPEQLMFHDHERSVAHYAALQRNIVANAITHLRQGGKLVYITCSVFKKENEEAVAFFQGNFSLQLERMEILKGYDKKADTLFAAAFTKMQD